MTDGWHWNVIVNRSTCKPGEWHKWKSILETNQIPFRAFLTYSLDEVSDLILKLTGEGNQRFLFAGGDGTLHQCGNFLLRSAGAFSGQIVIGVLPAGTGNDWVRTFGGKPQQLIESLKSGRTVSMHVLKLTWPDGRERYAFNMAGGALDAAVVNTLAASKMNIPGPIKYPMALLGTLMKPHTWRATILVDGVDFTGDWLTIQAGFGKYCGGGMYVLPNAEQDKAALLLMRPKSITRLIKSLPKLYNGKIAQQEEAIALHFSSIEIMHADIPVPIEADGEYLGTSPVKLITCMDIMQRVTIA